MGIGMDLLVPFSFILNDVKMNQKTFNLRTTLLDHEKINESNLELIFR